MTAGDLTAGRRVADGTEPHLYEPGDYGMWKSMWFGRCPGADGPDDPARTGNLSNHQVTEHDDGTITVQPSILVGALAADGGWHGYLERGTWREV